MHEQSLLDFGTDAKASEHFSIADAELWYYERAFDLSESNNHLSALLADTPWRQETISLYGRTVPVPRLRAWYADNHAELRYSGMTLSPLPMTATLEAIRERVVSIAGQGFNSVLVNLYRDGNDSVGWHSDDEPEFGPRPVIASVSFGAVREFQMKHREDLTQSVKIALGHGSCLVMGQGVQAHWQHQLPKRKAVTDARINLTFRNIYQT